MTERNDPAKTPAHLLIEGDYVQRLKRGCNIDGLVEGVGDPCGLSLGFGLPEAEWIVSTSAHRMLTDEEIWIATLRHDLANWGDVARATAEANFLALEKGGELKSAFHTRSGVRFEILTNAERTCHSIHLENEPPVWMQPPEPEVSM